MILTCPSCSTRYTVDAAKFPAAGRTVRCAKCGNSWHEPGQEPEPVVQAEPEAEAVPVAPMIAAAAPLPEPEESFASTVAASASGTRAYAPVPKEPVADKPRGQGLQTAAVVAGWVGLIAVVLLIGYSAVRYRQDIASVWPQSAGVYSGLGMPVTANGIDFRNVAHSREAEDGQTVLVVTGQIVNTAQRELPVPQTVRVGLTDSDNRELYHWTFKSGAATLQPGAMLPFRTRLSSPPPGARFVVVTFSKE